MPTCTLTERVTFDPSTRVDRDAGVIRGVRVIGQVSANGRYYPESTLKAAAQLYNGVAVFSDHPRKATDPRSVLERVGLLTNARYRDGAVWADLRLTRGHQLFEALLDSAETGGHGWGLSQNADADTRRNPDGTETILAITEVRSVDLVSHPATNKSLFESKGLDLSDPRVLARWVMTPSKPAAVRKREQLLEARRERKATRPPNSLDPAVLGRWVRS